MEDEHDAGENEERACQKQRRKQARTQTLDDKHANDKAYRGDEAGPEDVGADRRERGGLRAVPERTTALVSADAAEPARRGRIVPLVHQTFPLEGAKDAMDVMESREFFGKIVLTPGGGA